jgi:cell wall-associated NlpC family hydrolase
MSPTFRRPRGLRPLLGVPLLAAALALPAGPALAAGGQVLPGGPYPLRSGPSLSASVVGHVASGAQVNVVCTATGDAVTGKYGTTRLWDKLARGSWISDAQVYTGTDGAAAPACGSASQTAAQSAVRYAEAQVGKAYQWGATGPNAFDCSGLTYAAYKQAGVTIPRTSQEQSTAGRAVSRADLQPGDLVFSYWGSGSSPDHVAIYVGGGDVVEAANPQLGVRRVALSQAFVGGGSYVTSRRIAG